MKLKKNQEKVKKIKRMKTKLDTKIKWNKMIRDKIEKNSILKSIKSKTNNNQKNKCQNWFKYKLTEHFWFLKGLAWNLRWK
jgi:polyphosphate kinase